MSPAACRDIHFQGIAGPVRLLPGAADGTDALLDALRRVLGCWPHHISPSAPEGETPPGFLVEPLADGAFRLHGASPEGTDFTPFHPQDAVARLRPGYSLEPSLTCLACTLAVELVAAYEARHTDQMGIHAAAAVRNGRAVLFCGTHMAGKSALMARLLLGGWQGLGDDMLALSPAGELFSYGFAPRLRLPLPDCGRLAPLRGPDSPYVACQDDYYLCCDPAQLPMLAWGTLLPVDAVVILDRLETSSALPCGLLPQSRQDDMRDVLLRFLLRDGRAGLALRTACDLLQRVCEQTQAKHTAAQTALAAAQTALAKAEEEQRAAQAAVGLTEQALAEARERLGAEPAELRTALREREEAVADFAKQAGAEEERLRQDERNRAQGKVLEQQKQQAKATLDDWTLLNKMLGGEGGAQFTRYAQGITLRQLLRHATPHLEAMSQGRYTLLWKPPMDQGKQEAAQEGLLPLVVDNDQAGELRPVSNLSGGERFQVSLALALGLSEMSGAKVRVDSLFLDEGFGTLDGKTLEAAIDTLCRIHQEGRLVGIISHVSELAERIPTQIHVTKRGGGHSTLQGPGVSGKGVV